MTSVTRRMLLAASPQLPAVLPATVLLVAGGDRLPDPIASHFGTSGAADGFSGRWTVVAIHIGLGVVLTVLYALAARHGRGGAVAVDTGDHGRFVVSTGWAVAAFLGVLLYVAAAANLDLSDAADALLPGWWLPVAAAVGAVSGLVGHRLAPRTPPDPTATEPRNGARSC